MSRPPRRVITAIAVAGLAVTAAPALGAISGGSLISSVGDTDLGSVQVGKSAALPFTLSSTSRGGDSTIVLSTAPFLSGDTADFSIAEGTCARGVGLTTTNTCTSTVTFTPSSPGTKTVTVLVPGGYAALVPTGYAPFQTGVTGPPCTLNAATATWQCAVSFTVIGTGTPAPVPTVAAALTPASRVIRARKTANVTVTASNPGATALSNVTTSLTIPSGFVATKLGGGTRSGRVISWTAPSLAGVGSVSYTVTLRPIGVKARKATVSMSVTAAGATTATATGTIRVRAVPRKKLPVPVVG